MRKQTKITYQEALDLGFERTEFCDPVWEKKYGYGYFVMCLILSNRFRIDWAPDNHTLELNRMGKEEGGVVGRMEFRDMDDPLDYIKLFTQISEPTINGLLAKNA